MPGKQLKKPQLLSPVQNKPTPPSTLLKKHKSISVHLEILGAGTTKHRTTHPEQLALLKVKQ
jgi:hypothetical protein